MKRTSIIAVLLAGTATVGCDLLGIDDTRHRLLEVAPYKGNCQGLFETLCLQVREPGQDAFQNMYETPIGFAYQWGFTYVIRVEEKELDEVPADASSIRRTLDRQLSRTPVAPGTTFEITIPAELLSAAGPRLYDLQSESLELQCPEELPCEELATLVTAKARLGFTLAFPDPAGDPLVIQSWQECEPFGPCEGS